MEKNISEILTRNGLDLDGLNGAQEHCHANRIGYSGEDAADAECRNDTRRVLETVARLLDSADKRRANGSNQQIHMAYRDEADARAILAEVLK